MLADQGLSSVATVNTQSNRSWTSNVMGTGAAALFDDYLSTATTTSYYCWNSAGKITEQFETTAAGDC